MEVLEVDTLICGGGMAGMACAAFAAEAGAKTLVAERQAEVGGSSSLSAGMLYVWKIPLYPGLVPRVLLTLGQLGAQYL